MSEAHSKRPNSRPEAHHQGENDAKANLSGAFNVEKRQENIYESLFSGTLCVCMVLSAAAVVVVTTTLGQSFLQTPQINDTLSDTKPSSKLIFEHKPVPIRPQHRSSMQQESNQMGVRYFDAPVVLNKTVTLKKTKANHTTKLDNSSSDANVIGENFAAVHYVLDLFADTEHLKFNGSVQITLVCRSTVPALVLDANSALRINSTKVTSAFRQNAKSLDIAKQAMNTSQNKYIIELRTGFHRNQRYNVTLTFSGTIGNEPQGLYYIEHSRDKRIILSHLLPGFAHHIFPCFNDLAQRASFDVVVLRRREHTVLFNTPVSRTQRLTNEFVKDYFTRTTVMPPHYIALTVNNFHSIGTNAVNVYACIPEHTGVAQVLALKAIPKLINKFEDCYESKFPQHKLDIVLLPTQQFIAHYYPGLVLIQSPEFLYGVSKRHKAKHIVKLMASLVHSVSIQWFLGMTIVENWEHFRIIEALSAVNRYDIVNFLSYQTTNDTDYELIYDVFDVLKDYSFSSNPNTRYVDNKHLDHAEDGYKHGIALIRMIQNQEPQIKFVLKDILNALNGKSVSTFWSQFGASEMINTWKKSTGYPILHVRRFYSSGEVEIKQELFRIDEEHYSPVKHVFAFSTLLQTPSNKSVLLMNKTKLVKSLPFVKASDWLVLNADANSLFRVNYDRKNWLYIIHQLQENHAVFSPSFKALLLNDMYTLSRADKIPLTLAMSASTYLVNESNLAPWQAAFNAWKDLDPFIRDTSVYTMWKKFVRALIQDKVSLGIKKTKTAEPLSRRMLRSQIYYFACEFDDPECLHASKKEFHRLRNKNITIDDINADHRFYILCKSIEKGNYNDWKFLWDSWLAHRQQFILLRALGCSRNGKIIRTFLRKVSHDKAIDSKTAIKVFESVSRSNTNVVLDFVKKNWLALLSHWKEGFFKFLISLSFQAVGDRQKKELNNLVYTNFNDSFPLLKFAYQQAQIMSEPYWITRQLSSVAEWLNAFNFTTLTGKVVQ